MINRTKTEIETCLRYYIPNKYWNLNDWNVIIDRCEEVEEGVFQFRCSFYCLYFDENMYPMTYGNVIVCEKKDNYVYYDVEKDLGYRTEPPIPLGKYYWDKQYSWE